jgi:hypothetical protein
VFILFLLSITSPSLAQPSPDLTLSAFTQLQKHIRSWTPAADDEPFTPTIGACLTLKLRGEVIARSTAWSEHPFDEKPESPTVLRRVLAQALKQAEPKLGVPNDALRDEAIKQTAQEITFSLELAGPLTAIEPNTWDEAEITLRPGLDGVATRPLRALRASEGSKRSEPSSSLTSIFPAQMLLTSTLPHRALAGTIAQSLGEGGPAAALEEPKKIRAQHQLRFYTFRTTHAAQSTPKSAPTLLIRGQRPIPAGQPMSITELRDFARRLADHLVARQLPVDAVDQHAIIGTITPVAASRSAAASPLEHVLAAYAVEQYRETYEEPIPATNRDAPNPRWAFVRTAADFVISGEPGVSSLHVLLGDGVRSHYPSRNLVLGRFKGAAQIVLGASPPSLELQDDPRIRAVNIPRLPIELRPVVMFAMLQTRVVTQSPELDKLDGFIRSTFADVPEGRLPSLMPWLGWTEIERAAVAAQTQVNPEMPRALTLRQMRSQVWQHQLTPLTATEDTQDMIGGIVFTKGLGEAGGSGGGNPYPTWQCVRPLAFIATMLGDPRLTSPEERPREIANLLLAMRYLRQLQVDDASAWMYPNPDQAKGGIRAAVWDPLEPIDATSLTLLTVTELLKSLDKLAAEKAPAPQPAPAPTK